MDRDKPVLIQCCVQRLHVGLLAKLGVALVGGSHFHIGEVEGLLVAEVHSAVCLAFVVARWRWTVVVVLHFFLVFVLAYKILMTRRIIVVWEKLRQ